MENKEFKQTRFGAIPPSEREIVEMFIAGDNGVLVGYGLYNALGITTQISKRQIVYSSAAGERVVQIGNVLIYKYDLQYTPEEKSVIQMMELLYHYQEIQDINMSAMMHSLKKLSGQYRDDAFDSVQRAIGYPKWTIAFLREVLNYHHVSNNLGRYLSSLSTYPIPRIDELYEVAQKQI